MKASSTVSTAFSAYATADWYRPRYAPPRRDALRWSSEPARISWWSNSFRHPSNRPASRDALASPTLSGGALGSRQQRVVIQREGQQRAVAVLSEEVSDARAGNVANIGGCRSRRLPCQHPSIP